MILYTHISTRVLASDNSTRKFVLRQISNKIPNSWGLSDRWTDRRPGRGVIPGCGGDLFEMTFEEQTKCLRRKKIYGENNELANPKVSSLDGGMKMNSFFFNI